MCERERVCVCACVFEKERENVFVCGGGLSCVDDIMFSEVSTCVCVFVDVCVDEGVCV